MAARDFIKVDLTNTAAVKASMLANYISSLRQTMDLGDRLKAIMDHNTDGTVFTDIETLFGVPTGSGGTVYNAVAGAVAGVKSADAKTVTERIG